MVMSLFGCTPLPLCHFLPLILGTLSPQTWWCHFWMAPNVVCWLVDDLRIFLELHIGHSWKQLVHLNKQNNIHQPSEATLRKYYEQFCKIHRKNTCAGDYSFNKFTVIKNSLRYWCFACEFFTIWRILFSRMPPGGCFWTVNYLFILIQNILA